MPWGNNDQPAHTVTGGWGGNDISAAEPAPAKRKVSFGSQVGEAVAGAANKLRTDYQSDRQDAKRRMNRSPADTLKEDPFGVDSLGRTARMVGDVWGLATSPITGVIHAGVVKPAANALNAIPLPVYSTPGIGVLRGEKPRILQGAERQAALESDVSNALAALPAGAGGAAKIAAPSALAENAAKFERAGVRPSLAAMGDGKAAVAKVIAENPLAGIRSRAALRASVEDTSKAADRAANSYGRPYADRAQAGEAVQRNIKEFNQRFSQRSSALYGPVFNDIDAAERAAVATAGNKAVVQPTETLKVLDEAANRVNAKALSDIIVDPKFAEMASAVRRDANDVRFNDLRQLRTWVREAKSSPELRKGIDEATLSRLETALTQDIYSNAERIAGPKTARQLQQADKFYRTGAQRIAGALQDFTGGAKPRTGEGAYDLIVRAATDKGGADTARLSALRKALRPSDWGDVSATVISRLGKPPTGPEGEFSINHFVSNYDALSPQGKALLFGKSSLRSSLDNLADVARLQKKIESAANHSKTAVGAQTLGTFAGLANPHTTLPTAGLLAGLSVTGEMMTNPVVVRWIVRLGLAKKAGATALSGQVRALMSAANDNAALIPLAEQAQLWASQTPAVAAPIAAKEKPERKGPQSTGPAY